MLKLRLVRGSLFIIALITFIFLLLLPYRRLPRSPGIPMSSGRTILSNAVSLDSIATYFVDYPAASTASSEIGLWPTIETFALSLFPFLRRPVGHRPLYSLLRRHERGTKGVVIPVGISSFRFACHLVGSIRNVLKSQIPIEIAYAGESDLPLAHRQFLSSLGSAIYLLDVTAYFDDSLVNFATGMWAIKPFAILASRFEQAMLMDSDSVLLQKPETLFDGHGGFKKTGVLLFHDRLLFKNAFPARHEWWQEQMKHSSPSSNFQTSRVHTEKYAEEGESGLVVVDKARLPVLMGLLHVAWQNTEEVRTKVTYVMGYGDKESWWLAFELCNVPYTFESHYAAILGELVNSGNVTRVCSFNIAHTDENDDLLWFNGSLLRNKARNTTEFWVPEVWMLDGEWEKGRTKSMWSCMRSGVTLPVDERTTWILHESVNEARRLDSAIIPSLIQLP
ncbi:hypothetical protein PRK78_002967 [Emydomyces testavorans]|uniref:Alpha-1,3-mannosyltransferase n=1 Tax=Emydomyces testavorans TaxID=2070801 RepID=A0AAF0DGS7_9EURO|nr:hypothetical protein PRK78_002967 [Emydomyces testavorans]